MVVCYSSPKGQKCLPIFVASQVGFAHRKSLINVTWRFLPSWACICLGKIIETGTDATLTGGPATTWCTVEPEQAPSVQAGRTCGEGGLGGFRGLAGNYDSGRWTEQEGVAGRASSNCASCSPPAAKGLFSDVVEGAAAKSPGPGLRNGDFVLYPVNSGCLCFWAEEWQDESSIFRKTYQVPTKRMNWRGTNWKQNYEEILQSLGIRWGSGFESRSRERTDGLKAMLVKELVESAQSLLPGKGEVGNRENERQLLLKLKWLEGWN